jgi:hypothetical protein
MSPILARSAALAIAMHIAALAWAVTLAPAIA